MKVLFAGNGRIGGAALSAGPPAHVPDNDPSARATAVRGPGPSAPARRREKRRTTIDPRACPV